MRKSILRNFVVCPETKLNSTEFSFSSRFSRPPPKLPIQSVYEHVKFVFLYLAEITYMDLRGRSVLIESSRAVREHFSTSNIFFQFQKHFPDWNRKNYFQKKTSRIMYQVDFGKTTIWWLLTVFCFAREKKRIWHCKLTGLPRNRRSLERPEIFLQILIPSGFYGCADAMVLCPCFVEFIDPAWGARMNEKVKTAKQLSTSLQHKS